MRRIVKISIDNYRAYLSNFEVSLPHGDNVLIYGENGSGKSSLYKAMRFFLASSVDKEIPFELNLFSGRKEGNVSVTYADVDAAGVIKDGTEQTYTISTNTAQTNNDYDFIKTSYRASGFLDYSQLLKVYLNNGQRPNLYNLVIELLGNYVPVGFDSRPLREIIAGINKSLHSAYHRFDSVFLQGKEDYRKYEALFPQLIDQLNAYFKPMMLNYFPEMGLEIELENARTNLNDLGQIRDISIGGQVFVSVKHHGNNLPNYNDRLNEARLSAIATCLYLSSLKLIARTNDTRILFLDDVFIGLDLGNRLPVLDIVKNEFQDYQRIITTYDKSWYYQAKEVLSDGVGWMFYEMYEGEMCDVAGNKLVKPLLVNVDSLYGRALSYFSHKEHPDYPASANYLRKAFEELLQNELFDKAIRNENFEIIAAFKLTKLVKACIRFLEQMPNYIVPQATTIKLLNDLGGLLHPLLHPLSHYVPDIPTYKAELKKAINIYSSLQDAFRQASYCSHCKVVLEKDIKIEFVVKGISGWKNHYVLCLKDNLYRYDNNVGSTSMSLCELCAKRMYGQDSADKKVYDRNIHPNSDMGKKMVYRSLQECHDIILKHIQIFEGKTDIEPQNIEDMFLIPDETNTLRPLSTF